MILATSTGGGEIRASMRAALFLSMTALALVTLMVPTPALGQNSDENGGLIGLTLPLGARPIGQGRAVAAVRGELQGVPYNPATQSGIERGALTYSRFEGADLADLNSNYIAGAYVATWGTIGGHFVFHDFGEIPLTDTSPTPVGSIDLSESVIGVTYANRWREELDYGVTLKWYSSDLGVVEASGPAFDFGIVYGPQDVAVQLAAAVRNVGPTLDFEDGSVSAPGGGSSSGDREEKLPTRIRIGVGVNLNDMFNLPAGYAARVLFDVETDAREISTASQHFGGSVTFHDVVTVRGGVISIDNPFVDDGDGNRQIGGTFGIGIYYEGFEADIAREVSVSELGDETHFAVGWRF